MPSFPPILPEHFRSTRPHPAVAPLRCRAKSGYRSVYRVHATHARWVAKVRLNGRLHRLPGSASTLPHQAALHVAKWYMERYGDSWPEVVGKRMSRPRVWRVWKSSERGGWVACVWEFGTRVELTGRRRRGRHAEPFDTIANCRLRPRDRRPGRLLIFPTPEEAEAAVRRWVNERWGIFASEVMWRR